MEERSSLELLLQFLRGTGVMALPAQLLLVDGLHRASKRITKLKSKDAQGFNPGRNWKRCLYALWNTIGQSETKNQFSDDEQNRNYHKTLPFPYIHPLTNRYHGPPGC
jgi:hypothetical protein